MSTLFINGRWIRARGGRTRDILNPFDTTVIAKVDVSSAEDAAEAIAAARAAFDNGPWPGWTAARRAGLLRQIADLIAHNRSDLARWETVNTGKPFTDCELDVDNAVSVFRYYATLSEIGGDRLADTGLPDSVSRVVREPVGVCALITAWNSPLLQVCWKLAPALAAGNTVVLKPAELAPLTTLRLVELCRTADVPAGVVNVVPGSGDEAGRELVESPDVDLVSFTGGLDTGREIMRVAAGTVKRLILELGSKNPNIVFADADLDPAVDCALQAAFTHAGQACAAGTRLILQDEVYDAFVHRFVQRTERIVLGSGLDPLAEIGPLATAEHRARAEDLVAMAVREGASLLTGGARPNDPALTGGFFYLPTVLGDCDSGMQIVQEETLGPIVTVERFAAEHEAIELGNDTNFGLAAGVWTGNRARAERLARKLRHGTVWINDFGRYAPQVEWGGYKSSGLGRELGSAGLSAYQEIKHVMENTRPQAHRKIVGRNHSDNPT